MIIIKLFILLRSTWQCQYLFIITFRQTEDICQAGNSFGPPLWTNMTMKKFNLTLLPNDIKYSQKKNNKGK
jgi:hypothetical protein